MKFINRWWVIFILVFMVELLFTKGYVKTEIIIRDRKTNKIIYRSIKIEVNRKNNFERDTLIKFSPVFQHIDPITGLWKHD
mgnify:CR=1 FL=1|tara:strand:+ start:1319 stop:1561 length:243 start_codon:yes stop_codon:yes gene_type:complete